jgi:NAD(P)-dependent dehydrogenase (short-subunit alcohol dehydrogenase family)
MAAFAADPWRCPGSTMSYFVTGATGFIGKRLVQRLLARRGKIYLLVREASRERVEELMREWGTDARRVIALTGDITAPDLGLAAEQVEELHGQIRHFFHLAAIYDITGDGDAQYAANVEGTRHAAALAERLGVGCFHHTSSIAAAGLYDGVFREDMFEEATGLDDPYYRSKHDAEALIRRQYSLPWRIYRPGIVIGDSVTGEMDKIDGPYYFFKLIQRMRRALPSWMPAIGIEGGRVNLVPVDFVADAMDHIAHKRGLDGKCFHLTEADARRVGDVLNIFARAGHAPEMALRIDARMFNLLPAPMLRGLAALSPVQRAKDALLADLGIPEQVMGFIGYPTRFDRRETDSALAGSGIEVPPLEDYAWRLWDYWERHLDPDLHVDRTLAGAVRGKLVLITGASSGIGKAAALRIAEAGGRLVLVARKQRKLEKTRQAILDGGGEAHIYPCDVTDLEAVDAMVARVTDDLGPVDYLINNAGRSIRRPLAQSFERFHDFERTMQLNYFGALRLILRILPQMAERGSGQVINISSIGVLSNAPRFSAYVASKAALDAFTRCAAAEFNDAGVNFTTINMPLVRTPMIAPTKVYQNVPTLSPEQAADLIVEAIIRKPQRIATRLGIFAEIAHLLAPNLVQVGMNTAYRLFPDNPEALRGERRSKRSAEQIAFAQLTRGIHW